MNLAIVKIVQPSGRKSGPINIPIGQSGAIFLFAKLVILFNWKFLLQVNKSFFVVIKLVPVAIIDSFS